MKEMKVRLTFTEEVLGTASSDPDLHENYIASKAPDAKSKEEEIEALGVDESVQKAKTIFPKDENGNPIMWDYQIKGFFKDSAQAFNYIGGSHKLSAYKKKIDDLIFVEERQIPFILPDDGKMGDCQRPLRAETLQGPRVALANSETVPAGTQIEFTIMVLVDSLMDNVIEWLDYGKLKGIGQWRNSGKCRYLWEELDKDGNVIGGNKNDGKATL